MILTHDDFVLFPDDGKRHELIDGEHYAVRCPGTRGRDETIKPTLYERAGVSEYWIVDPEIDVVRIYGQAGKRFARPVELSRANGDVLTTPLLPGLELPLARILRE